jgi:hypothetical protein
MSAAIDEQQAQADQIKRMAAKLAKSRPPASVPSVEQASADASVLPTNPVARELVLACRWLRSQGR